MTHTKTTLIAALLIPGVAFAQLDTGAPIGTTEDAIRATLEEKGFEITEIEYEDEEIEVEAMLDGKAYEIELSAETGMVVEIELDDDDDDEDDEDDS